MKIFNCKNFKAHYFKNIKCEDKVNNRIDKIYDNILKKGDDYIIKLIKKYDNIKIKKNINFKISKKYNIFKKSQIKSIKFNIKRVKKYHQRQKKKIGIKSWRLRDKNFNILGQVCKPINKVLIYIPGGNYCYISSLIMNYVPAKIAGVKKIFVCTPAKNINFKKIVDVCNILKIKNLFRIGGAHAVISFSLGTKLIPKVNKIVGPGNNYVNNAKKKMFGNIGIDSLAGPTEILIITDGKFGYKKILYDILAQLEHDVNAKAFILSNKKKFLKKIKNKFIKFKKINMILNESRNNIFFIYLKNITKCISLSNKIAPEHVEFIVKKKNKYVKYFNNFGSLFLGIKSCEAIGDYCAGTNHVIPTNSNSKFSSPLGVNDFLKLSNIISIKKKSNLFYHSCKIAKLEGLLYHNKSLKLRK
ncbi:histidinol dehydrogenase [Candidatus Vidania fulgoroideorum]